MDWLADFWSQLVSWLDQLSAAIHNQIIEWINSLIAVWNGWMESLMRPAQAVPSLPALRFVISWLDGMIDYVALMYTLFDYVAYAWVVRQLLLAQIAILIVGLGFRAWLVIRRIVLVS